MRKLSELDKVMGVLCSLPADSNYLEYKYCERHRPDTVLHKAKTIDGFIIDPLHPEQFDNYPNENRCDLEIKDWWDRPYIVTNNFVDLEKKIIVIRYTVRCLDGGAWDRSTYWGQSEILEEAIEIARNGPLHRRK